MEAALYRRPVLPNLCKVATIRFRDPITLPILDVSFGRGKQAPVTCFAPTLDHAKNPSSSNSGCTGTVRMLTSVFTF